MKTDIKNTDCSRSSSSDFAYFYSGPHYGRMHRIESRSVSIPRTVTGVHEASGQVVTVPFCDVEYIPNRD